MSATTAAHQRIDELAARLLDSLSELEGRPDVMAKASEMAQREAGVVEMAAICAGIAANTGRATLVAHRRGRSLALLMAALCDTVHGAGRAPLTWCPHRDGIDGDRVLISAPLRFAGCATCAADREAVAKALLAVDTSCDVCGANHGPLTPRLLPLGAALVNLYTGPCCDELFAYTTPGATTTSFRKVGRNDACPCHSGRKFKHCCGAMAA